MSITKFMPGANVSPMFRWLEAIETHDLRGGSFRDKMTRLQPIWHKMITENVPYQYDYPTGLSKSEWAVLKHIADCQGWAPGTL